MLQCYELLARMALLINGSLDMDATSRAFAIESAHRMITALVDDVDFLPAVNGGDSFYAAHGDASAIGWVGASQPAATKAVD